MPKFDQDKPASTVNSGNDKWIEQDGNKFTYAEYNNITKKWEPDPKPLDIARMAALKVQPVLIQVSNQLTEIQATIKKYLPDIEQAIKVPKKRGPKPRKKDIENGENKNEHSGASS